MQVTPLIRTTVVPVSGFKRNDRRADSVEIINVYKWFIFAIFLMAGHKGVFTFGMGLGSHQPMEGLQAMA